MVKVTFNTNGFNQLNHIKGTNLYCTLFNFLTLISRKFYDHYPKIIKAFMNGLLFGRF